VNTVDSLAPFRKLWKGPIITANEFSTATDHAIDFAERTGSLIAFGRAFLANPDFPERIHRNTSSTSMIETLSTRMMTLDTQTTPLLSSIIIKNRFICTFIHLFN
jgi:2,4-dienoyl-CoA reductase-like NADH-dependent reductase (Old Yellow Enzyme family)